MGFKLPMIGIPRMKRGHAPSFMTHSRSLLTVRPTGNNLMRPGSRREMIIYARDVLVDEEVSQSTKESVCILPRVLE
jgi:hypothetical protein